MESYHRTFRYDPYDKPVYDFDELTEYNQPEPIKKQHPFPSDYNCPHCGKSDRTINTGKYFHCACGCQLFNEVPFVDPPGKRTPRKKYKERETHIMPCAKCGVDVITKHYGDKVFCVHCRGEEETRRKKEYEKKVRRGKK